MAAGSHVFDAHDPKVMFRWNGWKDEINSPIRLAEIIKRGIWHQASRVEDANLVGNPLNFSNLMR
jgi:hypothetical protein